MFGAHGKRGDLRRGSGIRALALGAAFLGVSLGIAAADAPTGVFVRSGDKLTAAIDSATDTDTFTVEVPEGAQLGVTVGPAKKAPKTLFPGLRIWDPDGSEVAPPGGIKGVGEKTKIKLKKLEAPIGTTGVWRVEVAGTSGTAGAYTAAFSVKPPKAVKLKAFPVPAADSAVIAFGATDGAALTVNVKVRDGAIPTAVFVVGPDGEAVPGGVIQLATKGKKTTGKAKKVPLAAGFGQYALVIDGGVDPGTVDVKLKVKWPKIVDKNKGKVPLPPELELTGVVDGDARQEAVRARLDISGSGFLPGTTATVSGDGVTVDAVSIVDADSLAVDVTVAADAPFGLRDLVVVPPPRVGEPKTLTDAVLVLAPLPTITGTSTPVVKQNDDEATVVVAGTGFRAGGTVEIEEPGITLTGAVVDSAEQLTLTVRVDNQAELGPRDVTYTQPVPGGADAVTAMDLFRVDFPDPEIDTVTPSVLRQGAVGVVVALDGAGFRDGATVAVSGNGVTPTQPTRISDAAFELTVDVEDDATYGPRDLSITQPAVGGAATGIAQGAFTVVAPDPIIASISPVAVDQGDTNVLITVTGEHFRDGSSVALTGSGLTLAGYTRVSNTQVTFRVDVVDSASLGPQTLTYTQPVAGGGAAVDLLDALQVNAPQPTATSISVASVKQLQTGVEVTFTGGELRSGGSISFSGTGVTGSGTTVDSRSVARVTIDVAEYATIGLRDATFTQPVVGGGRSVTLTDVLTVLHPDPTMSGIDSVGVRRTKVGTMRLSGTAFRDGCTVTTTGTGVTLGTPIVVSATAIDLPYVVTADAPLTQRNLTYTQPAAGGAATTSLTDAYGVFSAPPEFTSITPDVLRPGDTFVPIVVLGVDFEDGSTVALGATGVTTQDFEFVSITRFDALVSAASTATIGLGDVIIQPPAGPPEVFEDVFNVVHADPTITGTSHPTLARGSDDLEVEIHGTGFLSGATIAVSGSGVTFANVSVESSTLITADVDVTGTATLGARDLTVTHPSAAGGRAATRADVFEVVGTAPTVTAINPPKIVTTPTGGATRLVTAYVTGTGFATGSSVSVSRPSGTGISVLSGTTNVLSDTELEVRLSVAGGATTGTWDVQVTNPDAGGDSGTTGDDVLDIGDETALTVNQVVPALGSTYGGERVTVYGGGFVIGAVVDFGTERALRTQVIDENTLICTVPQPSSASQSAPTEVTVTVRPSSSSSGARVDGYAYARDTQTMYADSSFPAHGATGVPATLARTCVRLSGPSGTLPAFGGTASGWPEQLLFWFEDGSSAAASGAATLDASKRWLVFTRDTTSPLPATNQGLWRATVPATVVSLSGRNLVEVHKTADGDDMGYDTFDYTIDTSVSDTTAPTVSSFTPAASSANVSTITPIVVVMSEEVDPLTVTTTNITLRQGSTTIPCHIDLADDLRSVTLAPHAELTTSRTYTIRVTTGVKDLHGNAVASQVASSFATQGGSDTDGPTIESMVIEGLPSSVDGSGTYVSGADSTGSASSPQAAGAGSSVAYDLFVPRSGFELRVTYTDNGGVGIDQSSFSATCSAAIGSTSANSELASFFDVSSVRAVWRVPSTSLIAAGENVTFSFTIGDVNGNTSSTGTLTLDVAALTSTSQAGVGGNLDPFDSRQTWVLRTDLDAYTSTFFEETLATITYPRMTTTNSGNDVNDLDEALLLVGLATDAMTSDARSAVNGVSVGTNQIMRRLVSERLRELVRERFGIDADGTRDAGSPEIEFLLPGEPGSLSALPAYASSSTTSSSSAFSEISIAGTKGAESNGSVTARINSASAFDVRNLNQDALINTDGTYGVFLTSMLKDRMEDGRYESTARGMYRPFGRYVLEDFNATWGGTPVGEHASDDDVLAEGFDRSTSANTTHNDRYDAIHTAIETIALWASCNVALEVGQASGLIPDGGPKTGLFGHAHRNNTFTDATTSALNVSHRIYWAGMNNLMAPDGTLYEKIRTGSDSRRFNPLALAWLRKRILYDEGQ